MNNKLCDEPFLFLTNNTSFFNFYVYQRRYILTFNLPFTDLMFFSQYSFLILSKCAYIIFKFINGDIFFIILSPHSLLPLAHSVISKD